MSIKFGGPNSRGSHAGIAPMDNRPQSSCYTHDAEFVSQEAQRVSKLPLVAISEALETFASMPDLSDTASFDVDTSTEGSQE